ncbi:MAG: hypothetical protein QOJ98_1375 [Acidobacteriota bacterium]|nr:hypothetical protein [Acidobacteriota bacterium]
MFTIPGEQTKHATPDCPLRLALSRPLPPLIAGTKVTIPLILRNMTIAPVEWCTIDGASIRIRSLPDGRWLPVILQGFTTHTTCARRLRLPPAGTEDFAREIAIYTTLPPGPATIQAIVGFDGASFNRECGEALEWEQEVRIVAAAP